MNISSKAVKPFVICGLASLFFFYEFVIQVSPSVMTHELMQYFHIHALALGTASAFFYYAYTPMQLVGGLIYDRMGARLTLTLAALICAFGVLTVSLAGHVFYLGLGRFLAGAGSAFAFVGVLFLGAMWFKPKYFALIASLTEMMGCLGAIGGEAPVAAMVHRLGWQHSLLYLSVIGFVLAGFIWLFVRDRNHQGVQRGNSLRESLRAILHNKQLWAIGLYALLVFIPISAFAVLWGVPFLMARYTISATQAGSLCSMIWLGMGLGSIAAGAVSDMISRRKLPLLLCGVLGVVVSSMVIYAHVSLVGMYVLLFLYGVATSGQALSFVVVRENTERENVGAAMGFNNLLVVVSGAISQPLVGFLLGQVWDGKIVNNIPLYSVVDYQQALIVLPLSYLLGTLICAFAIKETFCRQQKP